MPKENHIGEPTAKSTISHAFRRLLGFILSFAIFARGISFTVCSIILSAGPIAETASSSERPSSILYHFLVKHQASINVIFWQS